MAGPNWITALPAAMRTSPSQVLGRISSPNTNHPATVQAPADEGVAAYLEHRGNRHQSELQKQGHDPVYSASCSSGGSK